MLAMTVAVLAVVVAGVVTGSAFAGPPQPAKGRGDKCVAPTDWMRRYHMTTLLHQRQETVHEGIRTPQFSLKGCIDCHQVKGADGKAVTVADPKHFCRTCHDYAAVRVDCFECHASRPGEQTKTGSVTVNPHAATTSADVATLNRYLEGANR
ncbi:MAG: cytochrome c3 family protein [Hyphomicrobiaceae bacterium]